MVSKTESDRDVERGSVEYNVTKRPSRSTAGNRYAKLLQGELEKLKDDFYQETYGGFNEEDNDNDFEGDKMEDDDVLDSDFNTSDEAEGDDEGAGGGDSGGEEGEGRRKRKTKRVLTRAYKEPKRFKEEDQHRKPRMRFITDGQNTNENDSEASIAVASDMKLRKSTKDRRDLIPSARPSGAPKSRRKVQYMSQEERLREAEKIEVINKESLEKFLKLEEEKKEKRRVKKVDKGPQITFKSYSCKDDASMEPKSFVALSAIEVNDLHNPLRNDSKTSRNVIIFPDAKTLKANFPAPNLQSSSDSSGKLTGRNGGRLICPVTRQPARYFDPLTQQPYSSLSAFKVLRQIYKLKLSILHSTGNNHQETTDT